MRRPSLFLLLAAVLASFSPLAAVKRPNFVFFLVDDLGWADIGAYGSTFHETPHIDKLAASGMKFTSGYAAASICSPTRASILTGRHPVRVNITDWIPGMATDRAYNPRFQHIDDLNELPLHEVTIAEVLREAGYATFFAGKWHLGTVGNLPTDQGFDFNIGGHEVGSPPGGYYAPWTNPFLQAEKEDEYLTERLTKESIKFLQSHENTDEPFLLYLSYYNVHTPIQPYQKRYPHYQAKAAETFEGETPTVVERRGLTRARQDNPAYASMVAAVDDSVGAILGSLSELGLDENTVVIFFSDNGGLATLDGRVAPTSNLPLRSSKGWLYEGGIREPMIVRAPGVTTAGTVTDTPVVSMDFFPTMLELAHLPLRPDLHADGQTLLPLLRGQSPTATDPIVWHYPHYHGSTWTPGAAIRDGDWKLIEFYEFDEVELYNLAYDIGETTNLAISNPVKTAELRAKLLDWQATMNAQMPKPNPAFDPYAPLLPPGR